jgi:diguanylate cyclase (GGDEF)-like protein/PAS domain S-box-containing protein
LCPQDQVTLRNAFSAHFLWQDEVININEPQEPTEALQESEARLQALLSSLDDLVFELDENGTYLGIWTANDALLVAPRDQLLGQTHSEVIGEDIGLRLKEVTTNVFTTGRPEFLEYSLEVPAGLRWFQGRVAPIVGADGTVRRICLLVRDITAQKEAEAEISRLLSREQLLSRLSESVPVGLFEVDMAGHVSFTNDRMQTIVGELPTNNVKALMSSVVPADRPVFEAALAVVLGGQPVDDVEIRFYLSASDGSLVAGAERVCDLSLRALTDTSGVVGAAGCLSDVTDRVQLRRELEVRASVDKLTSCLNRDASLQFLERTTAASKGVGEGNALIYIDLDNFKSVNDQFGHAVGDRLLAEAAERLRDAARKGDTVGRVGGDEFIVICPRVQSSAQAIKVAERVAAATTAMIDVGTAVVELRTSVGVAWTTEALDADAFLAQADSAMYQSKRTSRKGVTLFTTAGCAITSNSPGTAETAPRPG